METVDLKPLVQDLESNIDDLEEALDPLLRTALSENTAKLPLLDKAKLHVLVTYAIESILFSFLKLNGVNAREHPVFRELTRVKQYFEKIKEVESSGLKRENLSLDKQAAGRFIKHALAGNDEYDRRRAAQKAKEWAGAKIKFEEMTERVGAHTRFEQLSRKRKAEDIEGAESRVEDGKESGPSSSFPSSAASPSEGIPHTRTHKSRKTEKIAGQKTGEASSKSRANAGEGPRTSHTSSLAEDQAEDTTPQEESEAQFEERIIPRKSKQAPRGHSAAFQALLQGRPLSENQAADDGANEPANKRSTRRGRTPAFERRRRRADKKEALTGESEGGSSQQ